jgi:hypothetical protein
VRIDTKYCSSGNLAREGVWMMGVRQISAFVKHFTDKTIKKSQIFLFFYILTQEIIICQIINLFKKNH